MANQTFTNLLTNDKQFAALQLPPKAPTSNKNKPNVSEGHEILFQARNVMKTDENPSLVFHGDEQVLQHPNSPNKVEDLAQATNPKTEAQLKRMQANRVYSAKYRLRKQARLQNLKNLAESLEAEVSMNQSQLHFWQTIRDKLVEENEMMRAQYDIASNLVAEKEAVNCALMEEIQRLRNSLV
eukprot:XP_006576508.1 uncharacterized protein LOC102664371 [Glycine max]